MFQSFLAWTAAWFVLGIAALAWTLLCGVVAHWGEKEGLAFWRTFGLCILLTPLAGALVVLTFKPPRTGRSMAQTARRARLLANLCALYSLDSAGRRVSGAHIQTASDRPVYGTNSKPRLATARIYASIS